MTRPTFLVRQSILSHRQLHSSSPRRASSSPQRRAVAAPQVQAAPLKKFQEIPGPMAMPMLRHSAHVLPRIGSFHHSVGLGLLEGLRSRYGDLVRLAKGSRSRPVLYVFDPETMREVYESRATHPPTWEKSPLHHQRQRSAGRCPFHREVESLVKIFGFPRKEASAIWTEIQTLLNDKDVTKVYEKAFNEIADDFTDRLEQLRSNENTLNEELECEIYRWAIEAIGVMVFGVRLGCLDGPVQFNTERKQIHTNLDDVTHKCSLTSRESADLSTAERFVQITKVIADKSYLVRSEDTLRPDSDTFNEALKDFDEHYGLTEHFLRVALDRLSTEDIKEQLLLKTLRPLNERMLPLTADAFLAGVEPLVQTALSTLYHLSLNPAQQQRANDEIIWYHSHGTSHNDPNIPTQDLGKPKDSVDLDVNVTKDSIRDDLELSYLKGCGQEAMRLQPVTGGVVRRSFEELAVKGYLVPEGVDIVLAHGVSSKEENEWGRAKAFIPERWLDQDWGPLKHTRAHEYASKPFGEKCPVSGISEIILSSLLVKVLEKYRFEWHGKPPNLVTTGVNKLEGPFYFVLQDAH